VSTPVPGPSLRDALEPWCAMAATGALRVLDSAGGLVYLDSGRIAYAEYPPACGVDRMLTGSGLVSTEAWRAARAAGRTGRAAGAILVQQGLVAAVELEELVLSALYSAVYFLFEIDAEVRFERGVRHPFGTVVALDLATVCAEVDRRRKAILETWPDATVDTAAVLPARRLPGHHVALTPLQWEIVANADRRRTPLDLARVLGRDTFAMLLEVRRLARAGLVEPGRPAPPLVRGRAFVELPTPVSAQPAPVEPPDEGPLPRRADREPVELPPAAAADPLNGAGWEQMLVRIRDALEAL
jgi:hypothetical protein